jgi:hypothetical protein
MFINLLIFIFINSFYCTDAVKNDGKKNKSMQNVNQFSKNDKVTQYVKKLTQNIKNIDRDIEKAKDIQSWSKKSCPSKQ